MKCEACGSEDICEQIIYQIEGILCEAVYYCNKCGAYVDYWAYGHFISEEGENK